VIIASTATFFSSLLGIPDAIGIGWGTFPGKRIIYAVVAAPLWSPW
jgi:ABC-type spermidine/putrescine transport system permease subunit II